jgi:hypothetical protein
VKTTVGRSLCVGDTIEVWWNPKRDTIIALAPYRGPLEYLFPGGAQIATFALLRGGMTIDNTDYFEVISTPSAPEAP